MREWLYWHFPIITTRLKRYSYTERFVNDAVAKNNRAYDNFIKFKDKSTWAAINPIIHDLESLRADTWNQDKITKIQDWLRDNFEVKMKKVSNMNRGELCDFAREAIESCIFNDAPVVWFWFPNSKFKKGDKVEWHDMIFTCKEDHISGKEFDIKYWEIK